MTTNKTGPSNFANGDQPIFSWSIRDLMEHRHDQAWRLLSEDQTRQVLDNVSYRIDRADDRIHHAYADAADDIYAAVERAIASPIAALDIIEAEPKPEHQTPGQHPAERCLVFSLYWHEFSTAFELPDITHRVKALQQHHQELVNQTVASVASRHLPGVHGLYMDFADSLSAEHVQPNRPLLAQTYG